uniref:Uncharacterized protein n=1 Tax=Ceratitis capitata TaxID=7213 RepID=W8BU87_CERCA
MYVRVHKDEERMEIHNKFRCALNFHFLRHFAVHLHMNWNRVNCLPTSRLPHDIAQFKNDKTSIFRHLHCITLVWHYNNECITCMFAVCTQFQLFSKCIVIYICM